MRRPTIPVHGGAPHARPGDPVVTPISQSVSYVQEPGTSDAPRYTRYGNVPNIELVERRLAMLEGAEAAVVLSSGGPGGVPLRIWPSISQAVAAWM